MFIMYFFRLSLNRGFEEFISVENVGKLNCNIKVVNII